MHAARADPLWQGAWVDVSPSAPHVTTSRVAQVGDTFVLNCLGEGSYAPIMKARAPFFGMPACASLP